MMGEVIRVSGRAPDVGDLLREAMVSQRFADVALCCSGGQRFLAHRLVLSAASPYLQEVLLAHGKAAGYCEPITVILAEVEGPELAAILGFVYTGSATIPRSRLEAFTRAAETLHVRIPPFTAPTFRHHLHHHHHHLHHPHHHSLGPARAADDCKHDNVKIEETKIDSRYLRCEQYPSYDKWFNSTSWPFDSCLEGLQSRGEWMLTSHDRAPQAIRQPNVDISRNQRFQGNFHEAELCQKSEKTKLPEVSAAGPCLPSSLPIVDSFADPSMLRAGRSDDGSQELHHLRGSPARRFVPSVDHDTRPDQFHGSDNSVSRMMSGCWDIQPSRRDEASIELQQEGEKQRDNNDFEGRLPTDSSGVPSLPTLVQRTTGRSSVTFEKQDYDAAVAAARGPAEAVGTSATPSATVTSNIAANATIIPRTTACGESCCRWRSPRRHVANRVPASPWSQLARPAHNSPKIRPIVLRNREDSSETTRPQWNEVASIPAKRTSPFSTPTTFGDHPRESTSVGPLNLHHGTASCDPAAPLPPLYGFQVPKATEIPSGVDASARFVDYVERTRAPADSYDAAAYQRAPVFPVAAAPAMEQYSPSVAPPPEDSLRIPQRREPAVGLFEDPTNPRLRPVQECFGAANLDEARGGIGLHAISPEARQQIVNDPPTCNRRTSPRVELSHPISRLCDSVRLTGEIADHEQCSTERSTATATSKETIKINGEETQIFTGKPMFPLASGIIQSDSNNNEATVDGSILTRNPPPSSGDSVEANTGSEGVGNSEDHRCEQCGKTFVTRASLKVHGRTHSGEKPFRCNDCGKEFSQLRNYKYHRSVHEGTREFAATCPECGKYFNDRGYLSSHMKIHRNRKEYACAECGKSFNQRVAYNMHVRIHTGVKPHQCEQCGKAFSRKMLLKQHLRTHSGERPYQCQICHKAFADRSNMTLHTRLHSGLKPYQCTLCSKAFTKKHHLKTHLNYHTGTKPYSCPNCSLRFSQSSNMRTHYKKCSAASTGGNPPTSQQHPPRGNDANGAAIPPSAVAVITTEGHDGEAPPSAPARTSALTPPSSDQESSILTPISEKRCKPTRAYPALRSKDTGASIPDT